MRLGNAIPIFPHPLTNEKVSNRFDEEVIGVRATSFLGTIINFEIIFHPGRLSDLSEKISLKVVS